MKKLTSKIVSLLTVALMVCAMLPATVFAAGGTKKVTFYNPVTKKTDSITLDEDTKVAAIWADDNLKIQAQSATGFSEMTTSEHRLQWGADSATNRVIYIVVGEVTLDFKLLTQGSGKYIVGADNTNAIIKRGSSAASDLIEIGEDCTLDFYNITLDGGSDGSKSICTTTQSGGLLAIDGNSTLVNCTIQNDYIDDYVPDHSTEDHGTGTIRISANNSSNIHANVTMENCKVINNRSHGNGTGVYIGTAGTLTMKGKNEVTGNQSLNTSGWRGAGIYMKGNATLNIEGNLTVKDNKSTTQVGQFESDIYVGKLINVTGALTGGDDSIGIDDMTDHKVLFASGSAVNADDKVAETGSSAAAFFRDGCTDGCHVHQTTSGIMFCLDNHAPVATYTHTVHYDANGGKGAMESQTSGETTETSWRTTVNANGFTAPDGKRFVKWNTMSDGTGKDYLPDSQIVVVGEMTLYAVWEDDIPETTTITLAYDANGGIGTMPSDSKVVKTGETATFEVADNTFAAPTGKKFVEWNTSEDGTGDKYVPGDSLLLSEDGILYAIWTEDSTKVSEPGMDKTTDNVEDAEAIGIHERGDTIQFTLTSTVPETLKDLAVFDSTTSEWRLDSTQSATLIFHDIMSNNLAFNNDIYVAIGGTKLDPAYYSVDTTTPGETFSVTIDLVKAFNEGNAFTWEQMGVVDVTVTYSATVSEEAEDGEELKNEAYVNDSVHDIVLGEVEVPYIPTPPSTGGMGTTLVTGVGVSLMVVAAAMFAVVSKKKKENA